MANRLIHEHNPDGPTIDTGAPVPVNVDRVDALLNQLWRNVAEAAQTKGGLPSVTMAQVLNLIVRAESYGTANDYTMEMDRVTGSHPARVIMMITDPTEQEMPVQAWVAIHCQAPPAGGRQVCAEQISVAAGGQSVRQVPAAVIPLLLPELPVFLWWPKGSPFDDYLFRQLVDSLDRIIVDSATFENPEGTLAKMAQRLKSDWPKVACTDMNWERVTRWRELVAQFFDGAALRPYLDRVGHITIEFALSSQGGPVNRSQALLAAGWLASRLGWKPRAPVYEMLRADGDRPAGIRLFLQCGTRPISMLLRPATAQREIPGDITAIKLDVPGADTNAPPDASFEVALAEEEEEAAWISAAVTGTSPTRRYVHLEPVVRADLLDRELQVFSHDRIYEDALQMASLFIRGTTQVESDKARRISTGEPLSSIQTRTRPGVRPR